MEYVKQSTISYTYKTWGSSYYDYVPPQGCGKIEFLVVGGGGGGGGGADSEGYWLAHTTHRGGGGGSGAGAKVVQTNVGKQYHIYVGAGGAGGSGAYASRNQATASGGERGESSTVERYLNGWTKAIDVVGGGWGYGGASNHLGGSNYDGAAGQGYDTVKVVNATIIQVIHGVDGDGRAGGEYPWDDDPDDPEVGDITYGDGGWGGKSGNNNGSAGQPGYVELTPYLAYYELNVSSSDTTMGSVSKSTPVYHDKHLYKSSVSVTAIPNTGYSFDGWYSNDSKVSTSETYTFTITTDVTLQARFIANKYTLTFKKNADTASVTPASKDVYYNTSIGVLPTVAGITDNNIRYQVTRTGYSLTGWFTASDGGSEVTTFTTYTTVGNLDVYAHWSANTYAVTYKTDANTTYATKSVTYDSNYVLPSTDPTRTGYTFNGWFTGQNGSGEKKTANNKYVVAGDQTLYAYWVPIEYNFTFHFNYNNDSATTQTVKGTYDQQYSTVFEKLSQLNVPTRTGAYNFAGWAFSKDGTVIKPTDTIAVTSATHIYTSWTAYDYDITFHFLTLPDGGTITSEGQTIGANGTVRKTASGNNSITLLTPITSNSVYELYGWYTSSNYNTSTGKYSGSRITGQTYNGGYNTGQHLYARWVTTVVTISASLSHNDYSEGDTTIDQLPNIIQSYKPSISGTQREWEHVLWGIKPIYKKHDFKGWLWNGVRYAYNDAVKGYTPSVTTTTLSIDQNTGLEKNNYEMSVVMVAGWDNTYIVTIDYELNVENPSDASWPDNTPPAQQYYEDTSPNHTFDVQFDVKPTHVNVEGSQVTFQGWDHDSSKQGLGEYTENGVRQLAVPDATKGYVYVDRVMPIKLYAIWSSSFTVTFNGNKPSTAGELDNVELLFGITTSTGSMVVTTGSDGKIAGRRQGTDGNGDPIIKYQPTASLNGYFFNGWFAYTNYTSYTTLDQYVGKYVYHDNRMTLVTNDNKTSLSINPGVTEAYEPAANDRYYSADTTVYADWERQYHITFSGNGIPFDSTSIVTKQGGTLDTSALPTLPDAEDYYVIGWYHTPTPAEGVDEPVSLATVFTSDTIVYLYWKAVYRITFDLNDGTGRTTTARTNRDYRLENYPVPVRVGYSPMVTSLDTDGTCWWFASNEVAGVLKTQVYRGHTTLVARWVANKYNLIFDGNGGLVVVDSTSNPPVTAQTYTWEDVTYGMPYNYVEDNADRGDFPLASRDLYSFQGWSFQQNAEKEDVIATDIFNNYNHFAADPEHPDDPVTVRLYAVWVRGKNKVIFDPQGGSVVPAAMMTDADGTLKYYPVPSRLGYVSIGWYNWPVYYTGAELSQDDPSQSTIWGAFTASTGINKADAVDNTLLISTYQVDDTVQFSLDKSVGGDGLWVDASNKVYTVIYANTDIDVDIGPSGGQSAVLNKAWADTTELSGWTLLDDPEASTFPSDGYVFDTLQKLVEYADATPNNKDVAAVRPDDITYYFKFLIPDGVTVVLIKSDGTDRAYTWQADNGDYGGKWYDTTNTWDAVILPDNVFIEETNTVYAHWEPIPEPSTHSNTCYLERRISKYSDDTVRLYLPAVTSIEDTITASLVQKDTLMFGYENKFITDMGTTQRLTITVERANPWPYDDKSPDPSDWSNGKWWNAFRNFTNFWQNFGRDPLTGSMVGGFKFHYTPMVSAADDDRVDYSELYPAFTKNVYLTGNVNANFTDTKLKFDMTLAVGQMTSDTNASGYEVLFKSNITGHQTVKRVTPTGIDLVLPTRPVEWTPPAGKMFFGWAGPTQTSYKPGDIVPYNVAGDTINKFYCTAVWADTDACMIITPEGSKTTGEHLFDVTAPDGTAVTDWSHVKIKATENIIVDMILVGGGGAGAGGIVTSEEINTGMSIVDAVGNFLSSGLGKVGRIFQAHMTSGGAGAGGGIDTETIMMSKGEDLDVTIGRGGKTSKYDQWDMQHPDFYRDGGAGTSTVVKYLSRYGTEPYEALGGEGGKSNGAGGEKEYMGGTGGTQKVMQTDGKTAISGARGTPGTKGTNIENAVFAKGARTYWHGGAGGGATALCTVIKAGDNTLSWGSNTTIKGQSAYVSRGGNGASNGNNAPAPGETGGPIYGGGGGSGCCGFVTQDATPSIEDVFTTYHCHNPADGADGVFFIQVRKR